MSEHMNLKALERKAYTSYHQDGIVDIFLGLATLTLGIMLLPMFIENTYYLWGGTFIIWVISYAGVKRSITVPRIGYVEFQKGRRIRVMFLVVFLLFLNLAFFLFMAFGLLTPELNLLLNQYGLLVIGVAVGGLFVFFGWVVQIYRLGIYGAVTFVGFVLAHVFLLHFSYPVILLGGFISGSGFVLIYRFLKKYPKIDSGDQPYDQWENE
jgi:hypothetical protein